MATEEYRRVHDALRGAWVWDLFACVDGLCETLFRVRGDGATVGESALLYLDGAHCAGCIVGDYGGEWWYFIGIFACGLDWIAVGGLWGA